MRIAHVTDVFLPQLGGIETHVDGLARHQRAAGHDVHVLTIARGSTPPDPDGPRVHRGSRSSLRRMLLAGRFDAVHVHASVFSPLAMALTPVACAHGLPVAVTMHSMFPDVTALVRPAGVGLRLRRRPVAWSAVSHTAASPLRRALGAGIPVHVVPNAVDVDWWRQRPVSAPAYAGEVVVTTLGRISPRKRPLPLLRVMHRVRRQVGADVPLRLVVAGDGPQLGRLRREVRMLGMDDWVDLPGRLTPQQSRDLLHSSDVYVAPADLESFGIAALEARTVGLPVVAKSCGGVGEFVTHGTEGLLVGDDDDLVAAIVALVTDPGLRQRIAAHNTVVPPRTTWEQALEGAENLYRQAALVAGRRVAKREVVG